MAKLRISIAVFAVLCVAAGIWWDHGGQAWLATWTGTDNCVNIPARYVQVCKHYGFWSGFGSVIPWALFSMGGILSGLYVAVRHTNCHVKGCPRVGRFPIAGGEFKVCGHHHPGFDGAAPTLDHVHARHDFCGGLLRMHHDSLKTQSEQH